MLDVPRKGLWPMIPGVTNGMLDDWEVLHEQQVEDMMTVDPLATQATAARGQKVSNGPKPTSPNGTQPKPVVNG
jgi:hypothetical protein